MSKHVKEMIMRNYKDRLGDTSDAMVISLRGVKGTAATTIRNDLAKKKIKITVVRNSLAKKSFAGTALESLSEFLTGSSALAYGGQSVVEVAREIVTLIEKNPLLEMRGAILDGMVFKGKAGCTELSKFPTKDEAVANVITLVVSPARKLMGQIKGPVGTVGGLIKAIETKLEKGEAIAKAG
jgi:large subunit ribosomal protein L10